MFGDADAVRPAHAVQLFELLGGGKKDGGWDGSGMSNARLAIVHGLTHYSIFSLPPLPACVTPSSMPHAGSKVRHADAERQLWPSDGQSFPSLDTSPCGALLPSDFFNSIMFPSIFSLGVAELGPLTGNGSGILNMAIVGGAVLPLIQGAIADHVGIQHPFFVPVIYYLYILFFGLNGSKPNSERYVRV